jgi:methylase of polypeptide subunit release factors
MPTPSQSALDPNSPVLRQLHELLLASGYCDAGIAPTIHEAPPELPDASAAPAQLNTLVRLFFRSEDCQRHNVAEAIQPLTLAQLMQAGVVRLEGDLVSAAIRIQSYERMLYVFNRDTSDTIPEETLMLISSSSLEVAHLMTRHPTQNALDIGTGCGFLATVLAPFCNRVTAIDVNPAAIRAAGFNARWNGLDNISFLAGNLLEPVRGRRFDRIVCNPPFLITPVPAAFSSRYLFKHSGLPGDTFCINLAREASQLLEEGGYFHMVLQWEEPSDGAWSGNLEKSLAGLGCDVWVARIMTVTAEQYVAEWIAGLSEAEQADAEIHTQQARQYFREKNVATTSMGLLTLRRAGHRQNYLWFDEAPDDRLEPYGESVAALFDVRRQIEEQGDAGLLRQKLRVSPHLTLLQTSQMQNREWRPSASELSLTHGLKYSFGDVDAQLLELLPIFDGELTVEEVVDQLNIGYPMANDLVEVNLPKIRELLWYGFLVPADQA